MCNIIVLQIDLNEISLPNFFLYQFKFKPNQSTSIVHGSYQIKDDTLDKLCRNSYQNIK